MTEATTDLSDLSPMWRERFAFFEQHGPLKTPEGRAAFNTLSYDQKLVITMNWRAFFFGIIYLPMLGLWKRWLMLVATTVVGVAAAILIPVTVQGVSLTLVVVVAFFAAAASSTNYAYYLKRTSGEDSYNLFVGQRWQRTWF